VRGLARRWNILDRAELAPDRKKHDRPTALLGGLAIVLSSLLTWWWLAGQNVMISDIFPMKYLVGITVAGVLIAIGGFLDDRFHLRPGRQLLWPLLAALAVILAGIGVDFITNPFGGLISLHQFDFDVLTIGSTAYQLTLWADLFTLAWLFGMMYTTKILDGLDGLVSGVGVIGALIIFFLTLRPEVNQPAVALLALGLAGAAAGFLLFNWHPATIFLGESGSLYIGFLLGVLAIISGGKIATALLIMGLPILDLAWVIIQRRFLRGASPWRTADRSHLHFQLLEAGLSVRQSVLLLYGVTLLFGLSTLFVPGRLKVLALAGLLVLLVVFVAWIKRRIKSRQSAGAEVS
jgi:UDP-GlcNAc:undecaprenyl-phosphate GlcNAc-1-phosphate transferase